MTKLFIVGHSKKLCGNTACQTRRSNKSIQSCEAIISLSDVQYFTILAHYFTSIICCSNFIAENSPVLCITILLSFILYSVKVGDFHSIPLLAIQWRHKKAEPEEIRRYSVNRQLVKKTEKVEKILKNIIMKTYQF